MAPCGRCCHEMCLPCGRVGKTCCPLDVAEGKCSGCNHCCCFGTQCCECCPCGRDGCLGYSNHLCGCCGNCNLIWYMAFCGPCFFADLHIAAGDKEDPTAEWSRIFCNFLMFGLIVQTLQIFKGGAGDAYDKDFGDWDSSDWIDVVLFNIGNFIGCIFMIYSCVIFGRAASAIARKQNSEYEPAECCEEKCFSCWPGWCGSCTSCNCCLTYWCCLPLHILQVARSMEESEELTTNIKNGRPEDCRCCNCWVARSDFQRGAEYGALDPVANP